MKTIDRRLSLLDYKLTMELSVDDLRRILNLFKFVELKMEDDDYPYMDWSDVELQMRLQDQYHQILKSEGIGCI
jgi:hypothetical protein